MQRKHKKSTYGSGYGSYGSYGGGYGSYGGWGGGNYGGGYGSYSGFHSFRQEDKMYVREHEFYFTPSEWNIEWRLSAARLPRRHTELAQEMARFYYFQMIQDQNYVAKRFQDPEKLSKFEQEEAVKKEQYYSELWEKTVPGITPVDKAINALRILLRGAEKQGLQGDPSPMEVDMQKAWDGIPDEHQFDDFGIKKLFEGRNMEDFERQLEMLQRIAAVEDFGKSFEIKKTVRERRVTNSLVHKQKRMNEYEELLNSPLYQRLLPNYEAKLITKDLIVNQPVETTESKQKIIMLVDFSGSMNQTNKQNWILAILADRLKYCIKEECEIFFSYFLTLENLRSGKFKWHHIYNEKTALAFWKDFNINPTGGDTEVGLIIDAIREEILENRKLFNLKVDLSQDKPEILVINDGQDSVKTDRLSWKTNAITLYDGQNSELESLCKKTEGKYVYIDHRMDAKYSK